MNKRRRVAGLLLIFFMPTLGMKKTKSFPTLKKLCLSYCFKNIFKLKNLQQLPHELLDQLLMIDQTIIENIKPIDLPNKCSLKIKADISLLEADEISQEEPLISIKRDNSLSGFPTIFIIGTLNGKKVIIDNDMATISAFSILKNNEGESIGYALGSDVGRIFLHNNHGELVAQNWHHDTVVTALAKPHGNPYLISHDMSGQTIIWHFPYPLFLIASSIPFEPKQRDFYHDPRIRYTKNIWLEGSSINQLPLYEQCSTQQKIKLLYLARLSCGTSRAKIETIKKVVEKYLANVSGSSSSFDAMLNAKLVSLIEKRMKHKKESQTVMQKIKGFIPWSKK